MFYVFSLNHTAIDGSVSTKHGLIFEHSKLHATQSLLLSVLKRSLGYAGAAEEKWRESLVAHVIISRRSGLHSPVIRQAFHFGRCTIDKRRWEKMRNYDWTCNCALIAMIRGMRI